ncbi:MAG: O-antigen ligase family protein [Candidatus Omnitrophota bacterium]
MRVYIVALSLSIAALCLIFKQLRNLSLSGKIIIISTALALFLRPLFCGIGSSWSNALIFCIIVVAYSTGIFADLAKKKLDAKKTPLDFYFLLFLFFAIASIFFTVNLRNSIDFLYILLGNILFYRIIIERFDREELLGVLGKILFLSSLFVIYYGIDQYFFGFRLTREFVAAYPQTALPVPEFQMRLSSQQVFSTLLYPPTLAGYLILTIPLFLITALKKDPNFYFRIIKLFVLAAGLFVLLATYSKAGWILFFFGMFFIAGQLAGFKKDKKIFIAGMVMIVVILAIFAIANAKNLRYLTNFFASLKVRYQYAQAAGLMIGDRFFSGFGAGNFGTIYPGYKLPGAEETKMAHNSYLQIWAECGLFSFLTFLAIWFFFLRRGYLLIKQIAKIDYERAKILLGIYTGILLFVLHNFFDFDFYVPNISMIVWGMLAAFFVLSRETKSAAYPLSDKFNRPLTAAAVTIIFVILVYSISLPQIAAYYQSKGLYFIKQKKATAAQPNFKQATRLDPFDPEKHYQLAHLYQILGENADMIKELETAAALSPYTPYYQYSLGAVYYNHGDFTKARQYFSAALLLYPTKPFYHHILARVYNRTGNRPKAEFHIREATRLEKTEKFNAEKL